MPMTPATLPTTTIIFRNALLLSDETRRTLVQAQKGVGTDLSASFEVVQRLESLLRTPPLGRGMSRWLKTVAS